MEYQVTFIVTQKLIRTAVYRFWLRSVCWYGFALWLFLCLFVCLHIIVIDALKGHGYRHIEILLLDLFPKTFLALIAYWVVGYLQELRRYRNRYARVLNKKMMYRFSEDWVEVGSALGSVTLPWQKLERVQQHPDVWLLFFGLTDYGYLPVSEMGEPLKAFILQHALKRG